MGGNGGADLWGDDDESEDGPGAGGNDGADTANDGDGECELDDAEGELGRPHVCGGDMRWRGLGVVHF